MSSMHELAVDIARQKKEKKHPGCVPILNPGPLGVCSFALTTFVLSCANAQFYNGSAIVVGVALFYGGFVQLIAGVLDFFYGGIFGAIVFCSYGAFWISFGFTLFNASVVLKTELALGFVLLGWCIFTGIAWICSFALELVLFLLVGLVELTLILLTAGIFQEDPRCTIAGGYAGVILAGASWYLYAAHFLEGVNHPWRLPLHSMAQYFPKKE